MIRTPSTGRLHCGQRPFENEWKTSGALAVGSRSVSFGSTIGSAGVYPREAYEGWEYLVQGKNALAGMPSRDAISIARLRPGEPYTRR